MRSCQGSYFQQLWAYFLKTSTCTPRSVVRLVNIFIFLTYCGGLWCSMPFFNNISVISQFYWWRKPENREQTTNLPEVSDKLYHIMLYRLRLTWVGFKLTTLVVISTNCIIWLRPPRPLSCIWFNDQRWMKGYMTWPQTLLDVNV